MCGKANEGPGVAANILHEVTEACTRRGALQLELARKCEIQQRYASISVTDS